ncbi:hypothetical protein NLU13_2916 [Sarocladium strictum]|uniref:SnoaL-like domain-containing protein n=1 Tax=Sarocladium strictum TaxID=5046 RepID=A0AA39L993_SARSR|nr:hypothetical protein NLU13_2916 [Sarocladium strictum]
MKSNGTNGVVFDAEAQQERIQRLEAAVEKLTAESEVRKLHHKYGYYLDKCLYKEVVDLFSDSPDAYVQFMNGRFRGKESIRRLFIDRWSNLFVGGRNGPIEGWLLDHVIAQDIADFQPGTNIVKYRGRTLMSAGTHKSMSPEYPGGQRQWWEGGVYENEYIKEDGVWKMFRLRYYPFWHGRVEQGWKMAENFVPLFTEVHSENTFGPDELLDDFQLWPDTRVVPFHYAHPVTGKQVADEDMQAPKWREPASSAPPARKIMDWSV